MGRPPEQSRRDRQLNIGLSQAEYELIALKAAAAEMRLVDYGRLMLLREDASVAAPEAPVAQIDRLAYEQLKRLGNNLNQIARHLNATKGHVPENLTALLRDIRIVLNRGAIL